MTRPIIGIGGWMTAGKDALADFLVDDHGYGKTFMSEPLNLALLALDPLIDISYTALWHTGEYNRIIRYSELHEAVGYTEAKTLPEVRRLLQKLGTEVGRNMMGEDVWVKIAARKIQELHEQGPVVITGIRYQNELDMLHEQGGTGIWIARKGIPAPTSEHTSETSLTEADFDATVRNDGDLENDLRREAALLHGWLVTS